MVRGDGFAGANQCEWPKSNRGMAHVCGMRCIQSSRRNAESEGDKMNDEDEDLIVSLFLIAFAIFIAFFACLGITIILWSFLA
jgi:hypothetical protein